MAAKKTAAPKTTATKKATAPKASTKKSIKDPTVKVVFQYQDVEFTEASCVKKAQAGFIMNRALVTSLTYDYILSIIFPSF